MVYRVTILLPAVKRVVIKFDKLSEKRLSEIARKMMMGAGVE